MPPATTTRGQQPHKTGNEEIDLYRRGQNKYTTAGGQSQAGNWVKSPDAREGSGSQVQLYHVLVLHDVISLDALALERS